MAAEGHRTGEHAAQFRAVGVALRRVEEGLDTIERRLAEPASGATYRFRENLTGEARGAIRHLVRRVRASVATVCGVFQTDATDRSLPREIREEVATLCATLRDTKSALTAYGPLSREEDALVDECLGDISSGLVHILQLVEPALHPGIHSERTPAR